jgi:hypothetical protein
MAAQASWQNRVIMLKPLLVALALLCSSTCLFAMGAALVKRRRWAHVGNATTLGLCAVGSLLALAINPDAGANAAGLAVLALLFALALACAAAARSGAAWPWFWAGWLASASCAGFLIYLWLGFKIF